MTMLAQPPGAWGDGSAGALSVSSPTDWVTNPAPANLQFTDITITSVLTVPGGMTLRATGAITIAQGASIIVAPPAASSSAPYLGIASTIALHGVAGEPVARSAVYSLLRPPAIAGGSGSGWMNPESQAMYFRGGSGGGSIVLRAAGGVTCYGTIQAKGGDAIANNGGGGGGGGLIVIASKGPITGKPLYKAPGGAGSTGTYAGPGFNDPQSTYIGGGGGGGVIILVGPTASTAGIGAPPAGPSGFNSGFGNIKHVGAGASGGKGGLGPTAGGSGLVIAIQVADPSYLFL
jgi:hypothetical protein